MLHQKSLTRRFESCRVLPKFVIHGRVYPPFFFLEPRGLFMFILFWTKDFYELRLVCLPLAKFARIYLISRKWMWVKVQIKENDDILRHRAINSSGYYEPRTGPVFHTPKDHKDMAMQRGRPPSYALFLLFFFLLLSTGMHHHHLPLPPSLLWSFTVQFSMNYRDWISPDHYPYVFWVFQRCLWCKQKSVKGEAKLGQGFAGTPDTAKVNAGNGRVHCMGLVTPSSQDLRASVTSNVEDAQTNLNFSYKFQNPRTLM